MVILPDVHAGAGVEFSTVLDRFDKDGVDYPAIVNFHNKTELK
jgi:hypothetical protein